VFPFLPQEVFETLRFSLRYDIGRIQLANMSAEEEAEGPGQQRLERVHGGKASPNFRKRESLICTAMN
jgi:hypothetical protein